MNSPVRFFISSTTCALLLAAGAMAQSANRMGTDSDFVMKAAQGGRAEVELGKLAQTHASSEKVKEFGQRMVTDHSKANDELSKIATSKGVMVPDGLSVKDQATMSRLSALNGKEFDTAYMQDMLKDHREDISEFNKEASSGHDPDVKAFAAKTLPTLREHLQLAEQTNASIKKM